MKFNFDKIKKSKILTNFVIISVSAFIYNNFIMNTYPVFNEQSISSIENKIPTKNTYDEILKEIELSDKDNIVITYDRVNDANHGKNVKGIIDNTLNDNNIKNIDSFYIPKVLSFDFDKDYQNIALKSNDIKNSHNRNYLDVLFQLKEYKKSNFDDYIYDKLSKINKNFYINESFGNGIKIEKINEINENLKLLDIYKENMANLDEKAKNKIIFLNEHKNIKVITSAGNNFYHEVKKDSLNLNDKILSNVILKDCFDKLTNNNYQKTIEFTIILNEIIETYKIDKEKGIKYFDDFKKEFNTLFNLKNINPDKLMSFYVKDYLIHYDKLTLLKQSNNLINNNLFIVEAEEEFKILNNYKDYKKYHNNEKITNLDKYFTIFNKYYLEFGNNKESLDRKEINNFRIFFEENVEKYPEIFKYTNYGTFTNFPYHNYKILKRSVEGHNGTNLEGLHGTSFSSPEYTSKLIIEDLTSKQLEIDRNH